MAACPTSEPRAGAPYLSLNGEHAVLATCPSRTLGTLGHFWQPTYTPFGKAFAPFAEFQFHVLPFVARPVGLFFLVSSAFSPWTLWDGALLPTWSGPVLSSTGPGAACPCDQRLTATRRRVPKGYPYFHLSTGEPSCICFFALCWYAEPSDRKWLQEDGVECPNHTRTAKRQAKSRSRNGTV